MLEIKKCLESIGYTELTPLQKKAFDIIFRIKLSSIIVAPTGSGKTEAAIIPVFYDIRASNRNPISAIYITPLRALNRDIALRLKKIGECFGVKVELRHGDTPYSMRRKISRNPPHVLITTPESFTYIVLNKTLRNYLKNLKYIIIDELRDLIESKRGILLLSLIYYLQKLGIINNNIIKIGLTATLVRENEARQLLEGRTIPVKTHIIRGENPRRLEIDLHVPKCSKLCEKVSEIIQDKQLSARIASILEIIKKYRHVLIFVNTRSISEKLSYMLNKASEFLGMNLRIGVHHGSLSRKHRLEIEKGFRKGDIDALVATSSMELGIDIGFVNYVVQYMSPRQTIRLVQRIGRSGHKLYGVGKGCIVSLDNPLEILESFVLIKRAMANILEKENIIYNPLDVLTYIISVLLVIKSEGISISKLYQLITDYPIFQGLSYEKFERVIEYMAYSRIVRVRGNRIFPSGRTRLYLYKTNMIPETSDIPVIEISTGTKVGVLNEEYVLINVNPGDPIVLGGKLWKIVEYDKDARKLYVEKIEAEIPPIIPHWEGENIPVEYHVARNVGAVIRLISTKNKLSGYPQCIIDAVNELIKDQDVIFCDNRIVVEFVRNKGIIAVYITGGTRVNNLLKEILRFHIKLRYPMYKINVYSTPYYIVLQSYNLPLDDRVLDLVYDILKNLKHIIHSDMTAIIRKTPYFYWRIYQVGQRFGVINPATDKINRSLLDKLGETIIGDEALNEVLSKDFDLNGLLSLAEKIDNGYIDVAKTISDSIEKSFLKKIIKNAPILSESLGVIDYNIYKDRILSRRIRIICINCGFTIEGKVSDLISEEIYRCPRCGLKTLAPLKIIDDNILNALRKWKRGQRLKHDEKKIIDDLKKRALLLTYYGKTALILLASPGVGVTEAIKILKKTTSEDEMYRLIYESEKNYLRIKKYLDKK